MPAAEFRPDDLDAFRRRIERIEKLLADQQRRAPLRSSSISDDDGNVIARFNQEGLQFLDPATGNVIARLDGNGFSMLDAAGGTRAFIGLTPDDDYGSFVVDEDGKELFGVYDDGMYTPYLTVPLVASLDTVSVTSASFTMTHRGQIEYISHHGLYCWVDADTPAGTTGEVRLRSHDTGAVTAAVPIASGGSIQQQFRWLHGSSIGTGPAAFDVEARRTAGAGSVRVFRSRGITMAPPGFCVADGVP